MTAIRSRRPAKGVAILGAGAVGSTVGRALRRARWPVVAACRRDLGRAREAARVIGGRCRPFTSPTRAVKGCDVVILAMADGDIGPAALDLARRGGVEAGALVLHASGAVAAAALEPLRGPGVRLAALHPLQTFAAAPAGPRDRGTGLKGVWWFHEGEDAASCRRLVRSLGGHLRALDARHKALYHAAAVAASNYLVTVEDLAVRLASAAGLDPAEALAALLPLVRGTVSNLAERGLPDALTGPVARGDAATVRAHRDALLALDPALDALYASLGRHALRVARERGLDPARARRTAAALGSVPPPVRRSGTRSR